MADSPYLLDAVKFQDSPHVLGKCFWIRPLKMICDGDNVLSRIQGCHDLLQEHPGAQGTATSTHHLLLQHTPCSLCRIPHLVHPVLALRVCHALIQRVGREDQHEVAGAQDALGQLVLKLPCL